MDRGEVAFTRMEKVIFGEDAATAAKAEAQRLGAKNVFLLVSGTLNRETNEVEKLRQALGNIYCGTHDDMPAHSPREAVVGDHARSPVDLRGVGEAAARGDALVEGHGQGVIFPPRRQ